MVSKDDKGAFPCGVGDCKHVGGTLRLLALHKAVKHDIDVTFYYCDWAGCDYKAKEKGYMRDHGRVRHGVNLNWVHCDVENCQFKAKKKDGVKRHQAKVHGINVVYFYCQGEKRLDGSTCEYKGLRKGDLQLHQRLRHPEKYPSNITHYECGIGDCKYKQRSRKRTERHRAKAHEDPDVNGLFKDGV